MHVVVEKALSFQKNMLPFQMLPLYICTWVVVLYYRHTTIPKQGYCNLCIVRIYNVGIMVVERKKIRLSFKNIHVCIYILPRFCSSNFCFPLFSSFGSSPPFLYLILNPNLDHPTRTPTKVGFLSFIIDRNHILHKSHTLHILPPFYIFVSLRPSLVFSTRQDTYINVVYIHTYIHTYMYVFYRTMRIALLTFTSSSRHHCR